MLPSISVPLGSHGACSSSITPHPITSHSCWQPSSFPEMDGKKSGGNRLEMPQLQNAAYVR